MRNFKLNYNFNDPQAMKKALEALYEYIETTHTPCKDMRVRDMIKAVNLELYDSFSRGDKCRVGRGLSTFYNKGLIPELERGKKKGSTNTYHII